MLLRHFTRRLQPSDGDSFAAGDAAAPPRRV